MTGFSNAHIALTTLGSSGSALIAKINVRFFDGDGINYESFVPVPIYPALMSGWTRPKPIINYMFYETEEELKQSIVDSLDKTAADLKDSIEWFDNLMTSLGPCIMWHQHSWSWPALQNYLRLTSADLKTKYPEYIHMNIPTFAYLNDCLIPFEEELTDDEIAIEEISFIAQWLRHHKQG